MAPLLPRTERHIQLSALTMKITEKKHKNPSKKAEKEEAPHLARTA
jgi:hypothetical protein